MGTAVGSTAPAPARSSARRRRAVRLVTVTVLVLGSLLVPGPASAQLAVSLSPDRQVAAPGETVTFTVSSDASGNPTFVWNVDGLDVQSDSSSLQWAFQGEGQHTVTVTVDDGFDSGTASTSIEVRTPQPNHPPSVTLDADHQQAAPGEPVTFTASFADPDPGDSVALAWYVDGDRAAENGLTLTRSFAATGTHGVRVVATDLSGASSEASIQVNVVGTAPEAAIAVRTPSPKTRKVTVLDASGSVPASPSGSIVSYHWDLNGNGTFETTCAGPVVGVISAAAGDHPVSVLVTDDSGGTSTPVTTVLSLATSRLDQEYAPGALAVTAGGCAGPAKDGVVPEGYPADDLTCYTTVRAGIAEAMSTCFRRRTAPVGDRLLVKELYASTRTVRLNGIDVRPSSGVAIEIDTWTAEVKTIGGKAKASVDAGSTLGKLTFYYGSISWDLPSGKASRFNLGSLSITKGAELFGLSVEGDARLDLVYRGAEVPVTIHLPAPLDVSATVTLKTDNLKGLRLEEVHLRVKNATFGAFTVNDLDLLYNAAAYQFDGFADLSLTSVGNLQVSIQVVGRTVTMFAANFTPVPPLALGSGVFLQHIDFGYDAGPPLTLNGGVKLTAGPPINGTAAAAIEGTLKFVASDPWLLRADGNASIAGFGVASAYLQYQSNGMIRLGGRIDARLYDIVSAKANIDMWLYAPTMKFNAQARGDVCVWKGCGGGALVVSSTGVGGCVYTFFADFGLGYRWDGEFKYYLTGCDINHWASAWDGGARNRLASYARTAAVSSEDMVVARGERAVYFRFASVDDPPQVTVTGPDGTEIAVPAGTENFEATDDHIVLQVPPEHATYVIVRDPAPGRWQVRTADGTPDLVAVGQASALPKPRVRASVGGRGHARTLDYRLNAVEGQTVQFFERAGRTTQRLGTVSDAQGRIRFSPAPGPAGERSIIAVVQHDGAPREQVTVASYRAPGPLRPAATRRIAVKRTATRAVVTWADARRAASWRVVATADDGRRWSVRLDRRTLVLPSVFRGRTVTVTVRGVSADQVAGPAKRQVSRGR
ncbi:PKD domain-containing protein [Nocardioides sp. JS614]|uniref:PKD domain-containing protein n=1 Tax=Nocardioides sp. (strain ATCC BAA-499 / JS614) TaxID=196162 RepID=UPI00005706FE|nr:PKD domain-containing protein [Nocardioides sp. JS614]